jgi:hypothetical protein
MKRITLILAGIGLVLAFCVNNSPAQVANVPAPAPAPSAPVPPPGDKMRPMRPRQPRLFITRAMNDLRMVKTELQRSQDDFGGHKDSAIEACDKAMQELQEVLKASPPPPSPQQPPPAAGAPQPPPLRTAPPAAGTPQGQPQSPPQP